MSGSPPDPLDDRAAQDPAGLPRWVRLLGLGVVVVVVVLVVVIMLAGGDHGPGMHGG